MTDSHATRPNRSIVAGVAVLLVAFCFIGAGCFDGGGGGGGGGGGKARVVKGLVATASAVRFFSDQAVPGTSIARAAEQLEQAILEGVRIRATLDAMANSPDPWGVWFTRALCTGMDQLAERPEESGAVSEAEWRDFLVEQLDILLDDPLDAIEEKVDGFLTAVDLGQVSPRLAQVYFRECVARPR